MYNVLPDELVKMAHMGFLAAPLVDIGEGWKTYDPPVAVGYEWCETDLTPQFLVKEQTYENTESQPWCGQCAGSEGFPMHRRGEYAGKCPCCTLGKCMLNCIFCASPKVGVSSHNLRQNSVTCFASWIFLDTLTHKMGHAIPFKV